MNEELKNILGNSITIDDLVIPVSHIRYTGDSKTFITWIITSESPALSASDECLYSAVSVDIDIFSDGNYKKAVSKIKEIMKTNEWIWSGDSPEMYEEDTGLYHLTSSFEKERGL